MNQRSNEAMKQWADEPVNQWIINQWTNGSVKPMNQRINEAMNQWIDHWINESMRMNHWSNEPMNKLIKWTSDKPKELANEWMNGWMNEWMDGRAWASYFSLLRWDTSSLSYFFSEQPLLWATSALSCLPATSSVASGRWTIFLPTSPFKFPVCRTNSNTCRAVTG